MADKFKSTHEQYFWEICFAGALSEFKGGDEGERPAVSVVARAAQLADDALRIWRERVPDRKPEHVILSARNHLVLGLERLQKQLIGKEFSHLADVDTQVIGRRLEVFCAEVDAILAEKVQ